MAVVAAAVVVVDRAVRSAGKAFDIERDLGPQRCGLSRLGSDDLRDQGLRLSRLCL